MIANGILNIDPIALQIGPLAIRWYALAYITGLLLGWRYSLYLTKFPPNAVSRAALDDYLVWATLGIVLGGRLGYVVFYQPAYFVENPTEIFQMWKGGMSFHGGLLGLILAAYLFARRRNIKILMLFDLISAVGPIGLFFGRIANFINGELWGRTTDVPWGIVFPRGGPVPRHPSQLYEAGLEGLLLTALAAILIMKYRASRGQAPYSAHSLPDTEFRGFSSRQSASRMRISAISLGERLGVSGYLFQWSCSGAFMVWRARNQPAVEKSVSDLTDLLRRRIALEGPITIADYMTDALGHPEFGYYFRQDPFGVKGDFVTAPEISQMFGELIGLLVCRDVATNRQSNAVQTGRVGAGRGTLMADALRAGRGIPGFLDAADINLIETSPTLQARQRETLAAHKVAWHAGFDSLPDGPAIFLANEFFDALPIHQLVRRDGVWHERMISQSGDRFTFVLEKSQSKVAGLRPI